MAGALGVIAPGVRSPQEARAVVAAAKYAPLGRRGAAGGLPHLNYASFPAAEANAAMNAATMVMIQFESAEAIDRAEEIAAVEGVDLIMIGTNDFLADIGLPGQFDHPSVHDAYARTIAACRKHGKHVGVGGLAVPARADRRIRQAGRALCLDRHRPRLPAGRGQRARQAGARAPTLRVAGAGMGAGGGRGRLWAHRGMAGWRHGNFARLRARRSG